jgi:hypothetical protein
MTRQALYRLVWDDTEKRPPAVIPIRTAGPWGATTDAELIYEGPAGRTTVTVESRVEERPAKQGSEP